MLSLTLDPDLRVALVSPRLVSPDRSPHADPPAVTFFPSSRFPTCDEVPGEKRVFAPIRGAFFTFVQDWSTHNLQIPSGGLLKVSRGVID